MHLPLCFRPDNANVKPPEYQSAGASGFDLAADLPEPITLKAGSKQIIRTGIYCEIPQGFEIQIRSRSGLAAKHAISVLNSPATIDSDYRGELMVILYNHGPDFTINPNDRIAQAVLCPIVQPKLVFVDQINTSTDRGANGLGSTGI